MHRKHFQCSNNSKLLPKKQFLFKFRNPDGRIQIESESFHKFQAGKASIAVCAISRALDGKIIPRTNVQSLENDIAKSLRCNARLLSLIPNEMNAKTINEALENVHKSLSN